MAIAPDRTTELRPLDQNTLNRNSLVLRSSRIVPFREGADFHLMGCFRLSMSITEGNEVTFWTPNLLRHDPQATRLNLTTEGILEVRSRKHGSPVEEIWPDNIRRVDSTRWVTVRPSGLVVERFRFEDDFPIHEDGTRVEVSPDLYGKVDQLLVFIFAIEAGRVGEGRDVAVIDQTRQMIERAVLPPSS